jgi:cell division protein FtsW
MQLFSYFRGDRVIWMIVLLLSLLSLLAVYSSIVTLAYKHHEGDTEYYLFKHGKIIVLGLILMYITHRIRYNYFSRISQLLLIASIPLLLYTLASGTNLNNADRWIAIPGTGLTFQTSDFAKLALIMYLCRILSQKQADLKNFKKVLLHIMSPVILVCILILPANFSTAALLFTTCCILIFIGGISLKHIGKVVGIAVAGFGLLILLGAIFPKAMPRLETWKNRIVNFASGNKEANDDKNFQSNQAKIAIATGGITGKGAGNSTQRNFLPHPYSDFIYAIIIEEYGSVIGAVGITLLYLILLFRGIRIASKSKKSFGALLAFGLSFSLVFQAMINMAVAVNLFPVTGQPLPFLSMGGTSLLFSSIAIGVILSVSRETETLEQMQSESVKGGALATA